MPKDASLRDTSYVPIMRKTVAAEREKWSHPHAAWPSDSRMKKLAGALLSEGIEIGGPFPPLNNWARISIGLPKENALARGATEKLLSGRTNQQASALATARWNVAANCLYPSTCP